jgi:hypothetical protein
MSIFFKICLQKNLSMMPWYFMQKYDTEEKQSIGYENLPSN